MNIRQRVLDKYNITCGKCGKRVINAENAKNLPSRSGEQISYDHKTCKGEIPMAKATNLKQQIEANKPAARRTVKAAVTTTKKSAKTAAKKERKSRVSKSGKFKSIRDLVESLIKKNKDMEFAVMEKEIKKEYPDSKFNNKHYAWYRNDILVKGNTKNR